MKSEEVRIGMKVRVKLIDNSYKEGVVLEQSKQAKHMFLIRGLMGACSECMFPCFLMEEMF